MFGLSDQTSCFPDNPIPGSKKRRKYRVWAEYMIVILKRNYDRLQTAPLNKNSELRQYLFMVNLTYKRRNVICCI